MKKAVVAGIALAAVVAGAWLAFGRNEAPWPPDWYVDPAEDRAQFAALRRRAIATPSTEFPPNAATIAYLRNMAVGAASDPGERLDDARVYSGAGYVLQLRGKFSTAEISPPPGRHRRQVMEPYRPCLTFNFDTATLTTTQMALGRCEDLSFLGDGHELDLGDEGG